MAKIAPMFPRAAEELAQGQSGTNNRKSGDDPECRDETRCDHSHPEESRDKAENQRPDRSGLQHNDHLLFPFPQSSGSVQPERGENDMPEIEEAEKHKKIPQLDTHREERGEGIELREVPSQNGREQIGKGENARVEEHKHLE